jgi:hypothetical protein
MQRVINKVQIKQYRSSTRYLNVQSYINVSIQDCFFVIFDVRTTTTRNYLGKKINQRCINIVDSLYSHQPRVCTGWRGHFGQVSCGPTACGEPSLWPEKQINLSKDLPVMPTVSTDLMRACELTFPKSVCRICYSFAAKQCTVRKRFLDPSGIWWTLGYPTFSRNSDFSNVLSNPEEVVFQSNYWLRPDSDKKNSSYPNPELKISRSWSATRHL